MTIVEYLRMQASRCQLLSRTSNDLASATAFRTMAEEHLSHARLEVMHEQKQEGRRQ